MYMPGRLRTASRPSNLSIFEASYFSPPSTLFTAVTCSGNSVVSAIKIHPKPGQKTPVKNHPLRVGKDGPLDNNYLREKSLSYATLCGSIAYDTLGIASGDNSVRLGEKLR